MDSPKRSANEAEWDALFKFLEEAVEDCRREAAQRGISLSDLKEEMMAKEREKQQRA